MSKLYEENPEGVIAHVCVLPIEDLVEMIQQSTPQEMQKKLATLESCEKCANKLIAVASQLYGQEAEPMVATLLLVARDVAQAANQPEIEARAWIRLGDLTATRSSGQGAQAAYEKAAERAHVAGYKQGEAEALSKLGSLQYNAGDIEQATVSYEQALALETGLENQEAMGAALSNLGSIYYLAGDYERAAYYQARAATVRLACGDARGAANSLLAAASARSALKPDGDTLKLYAQAGEIFARLKDARSQGVCAAGMSAVREALGDLRGALAARLDALRFFQQAGAHTQVRSSLQTIAALYDALGDPTQATAFRQQAEGEV